MFSEQINVTTLITLPKTLKIDEICLKLYKMDEIFENIDLILFISLVRKIIIE